MYLLPQTLQACDPDGYGKQHHGIARQAWHCEAGIALAPALPPAS